MLQGLAGISTETMFSEQPVPDRLKLRLEELKATGVPYGKKQLAEQLGVKPYQLDIFARNYGIEPFWKGAKGNQPKTDMPKIYLTEQERMEIQTKAKKLGFAHTGDFIKSCVRQQMETEKTRPPKVKQQSGKIWTGSSWEEEWSSQLLIFCLVVLGHVNKGIYFGTCFGIGSL